LQRDHRQKPFQSRDKSANQPTASLIETPSAGNRVKFFEQVFYLADTAAAARAQGKGRNQAAMRGGASPID
jgi:hypothetical protein